MAVFVADTSALICVLNGEPDAPAFQNRLQSADAIHVSMGTVFEASCVVRSQRIPAGTERLNRLLLVLDLDYAPFDLDQLRLARDAYTKFGRGSGHPARLNMGDCFAYALAKSMNLPLLFKGDDFVHTDIEPALGPA